MKRFGLALGVIALIGGGLIYFRREQPAPEFNLAFLKGPRAEQIPSIPTRMTLLLRGTTVDAVVAKIGKRWTGDGWSMLKRTRSAKGDVCEWTNRNKGLVVQVSSGEIADLNAKWLGKRAGKNDILIDALTHVSRSTRF